MTGTSNWPSRIARIRIVRETHGLNTLYDEILNAVNCTTVVTDRAWPRAPQRWYSLSLCVSSYSYSFFRRCSSSRSNNDRWSYCSSGTSAQKRTGRKIKPNRYRETAESNVDGHYLTADRRSWLFPIPLAGPCGARPTPSRTRIRNSWRPNGGQLFSRRTTTTTAATRTRTTRQTVDRLSRLPDNHYSSDRRCDNVISAVQTL